MRSYYMNDKREVVIPNIKRFAVSCWDTVHAFAHSRPPTCVVCVLAPSQEGAQDHIRSLNAGFDAFETRLATTQDEEAGLTLSEFRNRYNTR